MRTRFCLHMPTANALVAAFFVGALGMAAPAAAQKPPIKVGEFLDLTGGVATAAEAARLGIDLAIKEINDAGGIDGRKLQVFTADTQTDPTVGVGEMKRLVQDDKVDLVFGPIISQVLMASLPVVNQAKIPEMGATGSELITPKAAPYYFSLLINAGTQAQAMVNQAATALKAKSGAILSDSGAQAKSFVQSMQQEMAKRQMKLTGTEQFQYRAVDMTPQLLSLKRGNPDTLFLFPSSGEDGGNALKSMDELGWNAKVTGNYAIATFAAAVIKNAGAQSLHTHDVTGIAYKAFTYCKEADVPKPFLDFVTRAKAFRPDQASHLSMQFAATLYDGVMLMKDAIEANGGKTDGPTIARWIEANAKNHKGILGSLDASATSHFLVGPDAVTAVYPDRTLKSGVQQHYGC
jgi:branched-chain amino acid transport system substrate-binding protein